MEKSESIKNLALALVKAQSEMPAVKFNKVNPFLKNGYADLGAIIDTAKPIMAKNGLSISQLCVTQNENVGVETILIHESGEWIGSTMVIPMNEERGKSSAQLAGSIITYMRRYAMAAILGMYSDEDGDGNQMQEKRPMKLTMAEVSQIKNRDGVPYTEIEKEKLIHMRRCIKAAMKSNGKDLKQMEILQKKQAAIETILGNSGG